MEKPPFRVEHYSHRKYKFVVRSKLGGRGKRRYFKTKAEAVAYAAEQNTNSLKQQKSQKRHSNDWNAPHDAASNRRSVRGATRATKKAVGVSEMHRSAPVIHRYLNGTWSMHLPFAYDLVRELRPRIFVELGVYEGESYFAFCQSVQENNLATQCYGIDTWRGDIHTGFYGPEIGREVAEYNKRYSSFSHLMSMSFKEALSYFTEGSIDLLHIDGAHHYEDVKEDFESWRPKLSRMGIVLFHDVEVRERGFGVYRLWEEIARPRVSFVFEFGFGLGVLKRTSVSKSDSPFLREVFLADSKKKRAIMSHYTKMAAEIESSAKAQPNKPQDRESFTCLQSLASRDGAPCAEYLSAIEVVPRRWCRLKMDLPWGVGDGSAPLRIDPADRPGLIDIAAVSIRSSVTGEVLWRANTRGGFEDLVIRGTGLRLPHPRLLRLLSFGEDPQIYLPDLKGEVFQEPLGLEVLLRFDAAPDSIERAAVAWNEPALPSSPAPSPRSAEDDRITMVVYSAGETGYSANRSTEVTYPPERWSHLDIALQLGLGTQPLRLDPLTAIGLIDVAAVTIKSAISDEVMWRANGGGLETLQAGGSAVRIPHPHLARILSYGEDPQIFLPAFPGGKFDGPLRLELWIKTETGFDAIRRGITELAATTSQALSQSGETRLLLEQTAHTVSEKDAELRSLEARHEAVVREHEEALAKATEVASRERAAREGALAQLQGEIDQISNELASTNNELAARTSELDQANKEFTSKDKELAARTSERDQACLELTDTKAKLALIASELCGLRNDLVGERMAAVELRNKLAAAKSTAESQRAIVDKLTSLSLADAVTSFWRLRRHPSDHRTQRVLSDKSLSDRKSAGYKFWLEHPIESSSDRRKIFFSGWVLGPVGVKIEGIRAQANGRVFVGRYGFEREDVAAAFSDREDSKYSG